MSAGRCRPVIGQAGQGDAAGHPAAGSREQPLPTALAALQSSCRQARRPSVQLRHFVEPLVTGIGRTDAPQRITKVEEVVTTEGFDAPGGHASRSSRHPVWSTLVSRERFLVSRESSARRPATIIPLLSQEYRPGSSSSVIRGGRTRTLEPVGGWVIFEPLVLWMLPVWLYNPRNCAVCIKRVQ